MEIKAKRVASPSPEPADIFDEGTEGYVEETAPPPAPKKEKTSDRVLLVLGLFLLAFIVTMIATFWVKDSVPDVLIERVLDASGLEALVLAAIKSLFKIF